VALVVFLRGVNVGGHRTFRPRLLAEQLKHLDVVNIGAAGTFVVRRPVGRMQLRREFARRLAFDTEIAICGSREIVALASRSFFMGQPVHRDVVRFVSILARTPRQAPSTPMDLPATRQWLVRVLAREGRFVVGLYRRRMKAIGHLGRLDRVFGVSATTRNWNTMVAIASVLKDDGKR
jgi:uncharacterized protein (DUF1697 family)